MTEKSTLNRPTTITLLDTIADMSDAEIIANAELIKKVASSASGHIKTLLRRAERSKP